MNPFRSAHVRCENVSRLARGLQPSDTMKQGCSIHNHSQLIDYIEQRGDIDCEEIIDAETQALKQLIHKDLPYIFDLTHLSELCGASSSQLRFFIRNKKSAYSSFEIPKKNGKFRRIDAPSKPLKKVQRWIHENILIRLNAGEYAHGFVPNRSIVTNATNHVNKECILCIDLKDFFPSIKLNRIKSYFHSLGYNEQISLDLAELCTYRMRLTQGAPTSPMLSNLITWSMDKEIAKFCKARNLDYSRYADDITISGDNKLPKYKNIIIKKITQHGFEVNPEKTRVLSQGSCQKVAGIIVNNHPSVGKDKKRKFRAILHNIKKNGPITENRTNDPQFKERLLGNISHIINVEPEFGLTLKEDFYSIDWSEYDDNVKGLKETETNVRSLSKNPYVNGILPFNKLNSFKDIPILSMDQFSLDDLTTLKEKCKQNPTNEECQVCLFKKEDKNYSKCIKHILGHYVGKTGGAHHGHEVCDIGISETISGKSGYHVCFIIKTKLKTGGEKDTYFRQFFDVCHNCGINVIATVTTSDIDAELSSRLHTVMSECKIKKYYCFITQSELMRVYFDFHQRFHDSFRVIDSPDEECIPKGSDD